MYARQLGSVEQLADEWRLAGSATHRHGVAAGRRNGGQQHCRTGCARWPREMGQRFGEDDPPAQFLHLDDLASAVVLAAEQRVSTAVYNVAPDGWVAGEHAAGPGRRCSRLKLPDRLTEVIGNLALAVPTRPDSAGTAQLHAMAVARWPTTG